MQYVYTVIAKNGLMYAFFAKKHALRFLEQGGKYSERYTPEEYNLIYGNEV